MGAHFHQPFVYTHWIFDQESGRRPSGYPAVPVERTAMTGTYEKLGVLLPPDMAALMGTVDGEYLELLLGRAA